MQFQKEGNLIQNNQAVKKCVAPKKFIGVKSKVTAKKWL